MKKVIGLISLMLICLIGRPAIIGLTQGTLNSTNFTSGNTYLLPEGVTLTGQINLASVSDVTIKSQTKGVLVGTISLTGTCNNIIIENLDISGYNIIIYDRSAGDGLTIINCQLHDCIYGIWQNAKNAPSYKSNILVQHSKIFNCKNDGWYSYGVHHITAIQDTIYNCNTLWVAPETDQKIASGDLIQWILTDNPTIVYCFLDRRTTGNKFCAIFSGTNDVSPNEWVINNNTFFQPRKTNGGGAGLYFYDLKANTIVEIAFNTITGTMTSIWVNSNGTFYSTGNTYENGAFGLFFQRPTTKGYSVDDSFINMPRNKWVSANVKLTNNN